MRPAMLAAAVFVVTLVPGRPAPAQTKGPATAAPAAPAAPVRTVIDPAYRDLKTPPCVDFYQYACGTWRAQNPIPPDQSRWGTFNVLADQNLATLRDILEQYARKTPKRSAEEQKIGDYYAACMDEKGIDARGLKPLRPELDRIARLKSKADLTTAIARLHEMGADVLFGFSSGQDFKNAEQVIAQADQGGLGLPDRDYYLKTNAKAVTLREKYQAHVQRVLELAGDKPERAAARAAVVLRFETELAKASQELVFRRDPNNVYHLLPTTELQALAPAFGWPRYFALVGTPPIQHLNVAAPDFFKAVNRMIAEVSLDDWKAYLTWQLLRAESPLLPKAFVDEHFAFYGKVLNGAEKQRPRWKRCVGLVDHDVGFALGRKYVERNFGADAKARVLALVKALYQAFDDDVGQLAWLGAEGKVKAREKLRAVANNIGYPDKWRDYRALTIKRGDALGNASRAAAFELRRMLAKIGKPVDRTDWEMTPQTVNAYYDPTLNSMNFPAGILQPPFFDKNADDAANLGAIGMVIGHELTHGFDDQGGQFDAHGNLRSWWTKKDQAEFGRRAACFATEYSSFTVDDLKVNGRLTLGENIADNGGMRLAHLALRTLLRGKTVKPIAGLTPEQRLFLAHAQVWCANDRPEALRRQVLTNPHSPPRFRVNGVEANMPEFAHAYGCKPKQPMVREPVCRIW